jgi:DMSO/TMAO reductase YedYZ heme-binding membrane subunit
MRSRGWPLRILTVASGFLTLAVIDHYMSHRPFVVTLMLGLGVFGPMLLWRYVEDAEQRRRTRAQQRSSNLEEQDASGS